MNNAWSKMVLCSPCFAFFFLFSFFFNFLLFLGSYKQYEITLIPPWTSVVALFQVYYFLYPSNFISIDYK